MNTQWILKSLITLTLLLIMSACNTPPAFDSVYTRITLGTLQPGDDIPAPQQDSLLTVTGLVGIDNSDAGIVMDRETIEAVGQVEYTVEDPFQEAETTFRGVLMRDLLELWQVDEQATVLSMVALNDYQVDVPLELVRDYPVIFALQENGEYMEPSYRGPAMLVLPYAHYEFERPASEAYWIWQIKSIDVQ